MLSHDFSSPRSVVCVILGGGGHCKVVIDAISDNEDVFFCGILDNNALLHGTELMGIPILGGDNLISGLAKQGVTHFVVGVGGVKDNRPRQRLFELGIKHGLEPLKICHPTAFQSKWAVVGVGSLVCPKAVINAGASLGKNIIVNSGAIIEHDCCIDDHSHIATGSILCGDVTVGKGVHVGAGATVREGVSIGDRAIVGAGAVVIIDVVAGSTVIGIPARPLK